LKAWSITTTLRNPQRIRDFLIALKPLINHIWDKAAQEKYQKLLIKNRLYGYGNQQFYNGLPVDIINTINDADADISNKMIEEIIAIKHYRDFDMRGRQSLNPLTKFGFVLIDNKILKITDLGNKLIADENAIGDVFLKCFIKWQIPNPASSDFSDSDKYNIVPFVGTLKLIDCVNRLEKQRGNLPKGLSKREFCLFVPTLLKYYEISSCAQKIIEFRDLQTGKSKIERKRIRDKYRLHFARKFLATKDKNKIEKFLASIYDYGDNTIRYFRLTNFIRIRGNGFYVDLEPKRYVEINSLFEKEFYKPRDFADKNEYLHYMSNDLLPTLPWQSKTKLEAIVKKLIDENNSLQKRIHLPKSKYTELPDLSKMEKQDLEKFIFKLRLERKQLQTKENHINAQHIEAVNKYIIGLETIFEIENRPLTLEYLSAMGLYALNDACEIKPNYPLGDDNNPTSTAPAGKADIECYYKDFNMICEVTMLKNRDQWFNEGQPVMRHLRDFEIKNANAYCLFIAPSIHIDTANTFYMSNKYEYSGAKQSIAPITIKQFIEILKILKKLKELNKKFTHDKIQKLLNAIVEMSRHTSNASYWINEIDVIIENWKQEVLNGL
jgi:hypothetical protein